MFDVILTKDRYEMYTLVDTRTRLRASVCPARGGIVTSLSLKGRDALYLDRETFEDPAKNIRGGIPILFPIAGRLTNNQYSYQGVTYSMKQHGFARNLPWEVAGKSSDEHASLTLRLASSEQTRAEYPFDFELLFTYRIKGSTLSIDQSYINRSSEPMPFFSGFHPYFLVANSEKPTFQLDVAGSQYHDLVNHTLHTYQGRLDYTNDLDVMFASHARPSASMRIGTRTINLSWSTSFKSVVIWTIKGKEFICVEPFMAPPDALNSGRGLEHIPPGETFRALFEIELEI